MTPCFSYGSMIFNLIYLQQILIVQMAQKLNLISVFTYITFYIVYIRLFGPNNVYY